MGRLRQAHRELGGGPLAGWPVRLSAGCLLVLAVLLARGVTAAEEPGPQGAAVSYARQIQPLLARRCFACHGPDAGHRQADLRLDRFEEATAGGGNGPAIVPGDPDASTLWERITTADETVRMPPPSEGDALRPAERDLLRRWIAEGARYEPHWLFRELRRPPVPVPANDPAGSPHPIDHFVSAGWREAGLTPAPQATARTLARRLSIDVRGLPAPADAVEEFATASATLSSPDRELAWHREVDRALADPAWGERLATLWFDLVRYADTVGYHGDQEHASNAYRQYVIRSLQQNLPFDRFTREQLAGDLLPTAGLDQQVATGYLRILQTSHEGGVQKGEYQKKYDADRIRNFGAVWLGMTVGCAECHDHKYDPISQRDFYALEAFFADLDDTASFQGGDTNPTKREPEIRVPTGADAELLSRLTRGLADLPRESLTEREALTRQVGEVTARGERAMVARAATPREIRVLSRGDWMDRSGEVVEPGVPQALAAWRPPAHQPTRLDLCDWLTGPARGIVARTLANRLWALFFGQGLSVTTEDGGLQGDPPSHPELLDLLADELIASGWDLTHLARVILRSHTYRLAAEGGEAERLADPENRWLTRQARHRLPAEMLRDLALTHSGLLVREGGGVSARPWQPAGYYVQLNFPRREYLPDRNAGQYRRAVYMHWQRQYLHPMLRAFDAPMREECTARRESSNTPQAALVLLNDPTFVEAARHLAGRVLRRVPGPVATGHAAAGPGAGDRERLAWLARELLQRDWTEAESGSLERYLSAARDEYRDEARAEALLGVGWQERGPVAGALEATPGEWAAWTSLCRLVLNLGEVLTRE
ncbi:MAG: PSD1 and planctomycete cytochrome C domain-containing protein [Planctomycetaceae bacterium]